MKKTKLLCAFLTACMMFTMLPFLSFAADYADDTAAAADGMVARIGDVGSGTYFETLDAAIAAVNAGETIAMIQDFAGSGLAQISGKTFTLDGNEKALTVSGDAFTMHDSHVTVKNLTLKSTGVAFVMRVEKNDNKNDNEDGVSLVLDNCTVDAKMVFKHQTASGGPQGTRQSVTIRNGSMITSGLDDMMLSNDTGVGGQTVEYTIDNSTLQTLGGSGNTNYRMFVMGGSKEKHAVFNVINGSRLIASTGTMDGSGTKPENVLFGIDGSAGSLTVNLDDSVRLELAPGSTAKTNNMYFYSNSSCTITVNDEGATWFYSKQAYEQGAYFPYITPSEGQAGWQVGNQAYAFAEGVSIPKKLPVGLDATDGVTVKVAFGDTPIEDDPITNDADAVAAGMVARIGNMDEGQYYNTWAAALNAVEDGDTIYLLQDVTAATTNISSKSVTITIDGQGHMLNPTAQNVIVAYDSHVTIRNLKMDSDTKVNEFLFVIRGWRYDNDGASLTFENCEMTMNMGLLRRRVRVSVPPRSLLISKIP